MFKHILIHTLALSFCIALTACGGPETEETEEKKDNPYDKSDMAIVTAGKTIYDAKSCSTCHGATGVEMTVAGATNLSSVANEDAGHLFDAIQNGVPDTIMSAYNLPEDDAWKVVTYIQSLAP